jgi:hypothetical protein
MLNLVRGVWVCADDNNNNNDNTMMMVVVVAIAIFQQSLTF